MQGIVLRVSCAFSHLIFTKIPKQRWDYHIIIIIIINEEETGHIDIK